MVYEENPGRMADYVFLLHKYGFYDNDVQDELQPLSDIYYTILYSRQLA